MLLLDRVYASSSSAGPLPAPEQTQRKELRCYRPQDLPDYFHIPKNKKRKVSKTEIIDKTQITDIVSPSNKKIRFEIIGDDYHIYKYKGKKFILPINSINSPTLCIHKDEKSIYNKYYYYFMQLNKKPDSSVAFFTKSNLLEYSCNPFEVETKKRQLDGIELYLKLLKNGFILAKNIVTNLNYVVDHEEECAEEIHIFTTFCYEYMRALKTYMMYNLEDVLPLIKEYIDQVPAFFENLDSFELEKIAKNNPDFFFKNWRKLFAVNLRNDGNYQLDLILNNRELSNEEKIKGFISIIYKT